MNPKDLLLSLFQAAVEAALPKPEWFVDIPPVRGRTVVIGAGKAAASMAQAFEDSHPGPLSGLVVTRYGHQMPTRRIEVIQAAHPVPDESSLSAAHRILSVVENLGRDDRVVSLMSGGGSSLLTLPVEGLSLQEKRAVIQKLLHCGASISQINTVRKHLSAIKGGKLLAACAPAEVVTYVLSDVPGDDLSMVASGTTVPSAGTPREAVDILEKFGLAVPNVLQSAPVSKQEYPAHREVLVGSSMVSLKAAAAKCESLGVRAHILSDAIQGDSREVATDQALLAIRVRAGEIDLQSPCVLLSGGETTVTVRGSGRGGRNVEFLAALALELFGQEGIYAFAADTDGIDGNVEVAGAYIDPTTLSRAGDRLKVALKNNDTHTLFEQLGDSIVTGPTYTNVNDFRAILITKDEGFDRFGG